jgi:hypothetical protein
MLNYSPGQVLSCIRDFVFSQIAAKPKEKAKEEPEFPLEVISNAGGVPIVMD